MCPDKTVGIVQVLVSALSVLHVRSRPAAVRRGNVVSRPDAETRAAAARARLMKESYFEMARQSRWHQ